MRSRLERLLQMAEEIRRGSYPNVETFCRMFEVKPRTVFADIKELKEKAGLQFSFDRGRNGYYLNHSDRRLLVFDLSGGELLAILVAGEMVSARAGTAFELILRSALDKIVERVGERVRKNVGAMRACLRRKSSVEQHLSWSIFVDLLAACSKKTALEIAVADGDGKKIVGVIEPDFLVCDAGEWLLAYSALGDGQEQTLPLSVIASCRAAKGGSGKPGMG